MSTDHIENILSQAIQGNQQPFNRFFDDVFKRLKPKLLSLTNSKQATEDIFIISMQNFWESFVINQEKLPHDNTDGYIFVMCKNAWLMSKRHPWNAVVLNSSIYEYRNFEHETHQNKSENIQELDQEWLKKKALSDALEVISPKCKMLIESDIYSEVKLKDLQHKLGYTNYQAVVQAKYNCKKRLIKKVYEILDQLKAIKQD